MPMAANHYRIHSSHSYNSSLYPGTNALATSLTLSHPNYELNLAELGRFPLKIATFLSC